MVVASHRTKKRDVASAVKQLETVEVPISGFVLNMMRTGGPQRQPLRRVLRLRSPRRKCGEGDAWWPQEVQEQCLTGIRAALRSAGLQGAPGQ